MKDQVKRVGSQAQSAQGGVIPGCLWGMVPSLDSYQSLRPYKMLRENTIGNGQGGGIYSPEMADSIKEGDQLGTPKKKSNKAGDVDSGGYVSDKNWIIKLNPLEIYKKYIMFNLKSQKNRRYPPTRSFSRTMSIHHLECDDYVINSVQSSRQDALSSIQTTTDKIEDQNPPTAHEFKGNETVSGDEPREAKKKVLERQLSDPDSTCREDTLPDRRLTKSRSYPPSDSFIPFGSFLKTMDEKRSLNLQQRNQGAESIHNFRRIKEPMHVSSLDRSKSEGENRKVGDRFKDFKTRIKHVLGENQKQKERISWDSVLHKIPYGSQASQKKAAEKPSFSGISNVHGNSIGRTRRSQSLTETLEQYAQFLESNSRREPRNKKPKKIIERISSLPEIKSSYFGEDEQKEVPCSILHSRSMTVDQTQSIAFSSDVDGVAMNSYDELGSLLSSAPDESSKNKISSWNAVEDDRPGYARLIFDDIRRRVDTKHEAEFLLLVDVFKSYMASSVDLSELSLEDELKGDCTSSPIILDEDLVNDLTHETLLETLENTVRLFSTEPMIQAALRVLRQAWETISWHLEFERVSSGAAEHIIDRDFRKNDGWMELGLELEGVALDVEFLLFNDLMEETLMGFLG